MGRIEVPPHAGDTNPRTLLLRDLPTLSPKQQAQARAMRKAGMTIAEIAKVLDVSMIAVSAATGAMRTPRTDPPRACLNVSVAAQEYVRAKQLPGEPIWKTVNRLFNIA